MAGYEKWADALDALINHHGAKNDKDMYKYQYFYLKNPPENDGKIGNNLLSNQTNYENVQKLIENEAKSLNITNKNFRYYNTLYNLLEKKRQAARNAEMNLFRDIREKVAKQLDIPRYMLTFQDATNSRGAVTLDAPAVITINKNITMPDYEFWTYVAWGNFPNRYLKEITGVDKTLWFEGEGSTKRCFRLILSSKEFYNKLKNYTPSYFRRHLAVKGVKESELNEKARKELRNQLNTIFSNVTEKELQADLFEVLQKYFDEKSEKINSARYFSSQLRSALQQILRSEKNKKNDGTYYLSGIEIKNSDDQIYFTVPLDGNNNIALHQLNVNKDKDFIQTTFEAFHSAIVQLKNDNLDKLTFTNFEDVNIKNLISETGRKIDIFSKALQYCTIINVEKEFIDNAPDKYRQSIYGAFKAYNSNAYISGLLGEIQSLYSAKNIFGDRSFLMGGAKGELGQSASDIIGLLKEKTYGMNVKNFMEGYKPLYESTTVSVLGQGSQYLEKYYEKDVEIMKFIFSNPHYFSEEQLLRFMEESSHKHFSNFIRAEERGFSKEDFSSVKTIKNIFYVINGIVIPTSYIYTMAIQQLQNSSNDPFFEVKLLNNDNNGTKGKSYQNLNNAIRYYNLNNFIINNSMDGSKSNAIVYFKGLDIKDNMNLIKFSLF